MRNFIPQAIQKRYHTRSDKEHCDALSLRVDMSGSTPIPTVMTMFQGAFGHLQADIVPKDIEELVSIVHKVMSGPMRSYHTLDHVFTLLSPSDPLQSLAALFHDLVYYQVDKRFSPEIAHLLSPYIQEQAGELFLTEERPDDKLFRLALVIFGFEEGQHLSVGAGLNEFLSALVMLTTLGTILAEKDLVKICVCIEASIPFRKNNDRGESYADLLEKRLNDLNTQDNLFMDVQEIKESVQRAVVFANRDVENFAEQDVAQFLDNTWKLLPEIHSALRSETYSIKDYRQALQKMEHFLGALDPDTIFHHYNGVPHEQELQPMVKRAHRNVTIARQYLGIKLLAIAILEALAEMTGGDAPLSFFVGDCPHEGQHGHQLEDFLPVAADSHGVDRSSPVFHLLDSGRTHASGFDIKRSPLSVFLYKILGPTRIEQLLKNAKAMFDGKLRAQEFLASVDQPIIGAIAKASASIALSRSKALLRYALPEYSQDVGPNDLSFPHICLSKVLTMLCSIPVFPRR